MEAHRVQAARGITVTVGNPADAEVFSGNNPPTLSTRAKSAVAGMLAAGMLTIGAMSPADASDRCTGCETSPWTAEQQVEREAAAQQHQKKYGWMNAETCDTAENVRLSNGGIPRDGSTSPAVALSDCTKPSTAAKPAKTTKRGGPGLDMGLD